MPPVIATHNRSSQWQPRLDWSQQVHVQWGDRGLVLGSKPYCTAFFEAFPHDGSAGFIRGEGVDLDAAETSAHGQWTRSLGCSQAGHRWTRARRVGSKDGKPRVHTYTNGGCFCLRCNAFQSVMPAIVVLGNWRRPLDAMALNSIAMGFCRPERRGEAEDASSRKYRRSMELRARLAGIALPDSGLYDESKSLFDDEPYAKACRLAVGRFCLENPIAASTEHSRSGSMESLFQRLAKEYVENATKEAQAQAVTP